MPLTSGSVGRREVRWRSVLIITTIICLTLILSINSPCISILPTAGASSTTPITVDAISTMADDEFDDDDFAFGAYDEIFNPVPNVVVEIYINSELYDSGETNEEEGVTVFYDVPVGTYSWKAFYDGEEIAAGTLVSNGAQISIEAYSDIRDCELDDDDFAFYAYAENLVPVSNVVIEIYKDGSLHSVNETDVNGKALFFDLQAGSYHWRAYYDGVEIGSGSLTSNNKRMQAAEVSSPTSNAIIEDVITITTSVSEYLYITKVEFYIDGDFKYADTTPPFEWNCDTTTYSNDVHTIRALFYDNLGNSIYDEISVSVENVQDTIDIVFLVMAVTVVAIAVLALGVWKVSRSKKASHSRTWEPKT